MRKLCSFGPPPNQLLLPVALLPLNPSPIRSAIEVIPARHDDDDFGVDPGVWLRDGGVSVGLQVVLELLLGVAVACRSSSGAATRVGEDEDGSDGFRRFGGGVASLEVDW